MDQARARELVAAFPAAHVLVLGDLMLDRYVWGDVERISPEAPVPVVRVDRESRMLGGAGNVARNLASLGAQVEVAAVVGDDDAAAELERLFIDWKIDPGGLVIEPGRPTTQKTRVIARAQQVVRFDRESEQPVSASSRARLLESLRSRASRFQGVIVQDYAKGLLGRELVEQAMPIFHEQELRVFVDPKSEPWDAYSGAELVKPNLREAHEIVGARLEASSDLESVGRAVLERTGAQVVALTRGDQGMTIFSRAGETRHVPTVERAVADVAGAGDTAIAVLALGRLAGASWLEAATLANAAAGFVVGVPGTAALNPSDLLAALGAEP